MQCRLGRSTPICDLPASCRDTGWISASYNTYLNKVIIVASMYDEPGKAYVNAYITTTANGYSNLEPWTELFNEAYENLYINIVGDGSDPLYTDDTFYLYYTRFHLATLPPNYGWERWNDASIERRQITVIPG